MLPQKNVERCLHGVKLCPFRGRNRSVRFGERFLQVTLVNSERQGRAVPPGTAALLATTTMTQHIFRQCLHLQGRVVSGHTHLRQNVASKLYLERCADASSRKVL